MRLILDTNVLISYILAENSESKAARAVDEAVIRGTVIFTQSTFDEFRKVLFRPKFDRYTTNIFRDEFVKYLSEVSEFVTVQEIIRACRDPDDDKFLEAAINGNAGIIITGDKDLLAMNGFMQLKIITPAEFLGS